MITQRFLEGGVAHNLFAYPWISNKKTSAHAICARIYNRFAIRTPTKNRTDIDWQLSMELTSPVVVVGGAYHHHTTTGAAGHAGRAARIEKQIAFCTVPGFFVCCYTLCVRLWRGWEW